jgi:hypothetical protein
MAQCAPLIAPYVLIDGGRVPNGVYRREIMPATFAYCERYSREIGIERFAPHCGNDIAPCLGTDPNCLGIEHRLRTTLFHPGAKRRSVHESN